MDSAFTAMAEPRRRRILELLRGREMTAGEVAREFEVTRPAISQHLRVLKEAGLIDERREGTRRFYRVRPEGLDDIHAYLDGFWGSALERLKLQAELDERRDRSTHEGARPR